MEERKLSVFPIYLVGKGMVRLSKKALSDQNMLLSEIVRHWALEVAQWQVNIYEDLIEGGMAGLAWKR